MNVSVPVTVGDQKEYSTPRDRTYNERLSMAGPHNHSAVELFRATPVTSTLLSFAPLVLALGQLGNSYINGVSPAVSVSFAVVMIGFAVVAMRHHAAEYRLRRLDPRVRS